MTVIRHDDALRTVYLWNSLEQLALSVVDGWMKSPGHWKNILKPLWKPEGIGVVVSSDGRIWITRNFC